MQETNAADAIRRDEKGRPLADDGYPLSGLATVPEVLAIAHLSRSKLYEMLAGGELEAKRFGRACRIPWPEVRRVFLSRQRCDTAQ